ncbi:MAG: hypothetical protein AAFO03_27890 [Bacteroidota bacterium]
MKTTIRDYLDDRLSPEDDEQLTRHLFQAYFTELDEGRQQQWAQWLSEKQGIERTPKTNLSVRVKKKISVRWVAALAAVAVVALFIFFNGVELGNNLQDQVQAHLETVLPESEIRKGEIVGAAEQEILARLAYNEHRFAEAELLWQRLSEQYPEASEYKFLQALSALYQPSPNYEKVGLMMDDLAANSRFWGEQARWYLSLIRIKQGHNEEARQLLHDIVEKDDWKSAEATKLLEYLD